MQSLLAFYIKENRLIEFKPVGQIVDAQPTETLHPWNPTPLSPSPDHAVSFNMTAHTKSLSREEIQVQI